MDPQLVTRAQRGDRDAFAALATALAERLHGVAYGILRDRELARDSTQQALMSIWRDLPRLREPARFEAWSYRILVRICHVELRKARRWMPALVVQASLEPYATDELGAIVDREQLERGFRCLSSGHRAVVVLHHYLALPLDEVAHVLGIPEGTARSRLHRAMKALRAALDADARLTPAAIVHEKVTL
jgi:RNA polymerase sigma-70 factor (ECF subfamily)